MPSRPARQVSSGGIIVRTHRGRHEVCLIKRRHIGVVVWGLPKGHVEAGEGTEATALREVREETGLQGEMIRPVGSITYWFSVAGKRTRYFKRVHFYLMRYLAGDTGGHDDEVDEAAWLPWEEAAARLTYPNERRMLSAAKRHLAPIASRAPRFPGTRRIILRACECLIRCLAIPTHG